MTETCIVLSLTVPSAPGLIKHESSNFAHNDLQINWTAPVNTVVTNYEVTIDNTTYTTMSSDTMYQFTGKVFVPGKSYDISIVTVSGTTSDIVKKSSNHTESIRTTPTSKRNTSYKMYIYQYKKCFSKSARVYRIHTCCNCAFFLFFLLDVLFLNNIYLFLFLHNKLR